MSVVSVSEKEVTLRAEISLSFVYIRPLGTVTVDYTVLGSGDLIVKSHLDVSKYKFISAFEMPPLPRFGFEFKMPEGNERIVYFGRGETENYVDMHHASKKGLFETTATDNFEHYVRPQENMAHGETDFVAVSNLSGHGLFAFSTGNSFSFNCSHFTPKQLTETAHDYELIPLKETVVNIDYRHAGIGSASCGQTLAKKWQLCEKSIDFEFRLSPAFINDVDPFEEFGRK